LIIISIYSTTEVAGLAPGVQNMTSWKGFVESSRRSLFQHWGWTM